MASEYAVGEMAQKLAREGTPEEVASLTRQLRNWTVLGLLTPVGEKHEGTGRHRRYDDSSLLKAALLEVLARNFKIDITGLQAFAALYESQARFFATMMTWEARRKPDSFYFWMGFQNGQVRRFGSDREAAPADFDVQVKEHEVLLVIDLAAIARRVFS